MNKDVFIYRYSVPINKEVQEIRKKYLPKPESKLEELRRLDHTVQRAGTVESLVLGSVGTLLFGMGLCFAMHILKGSFLFGVLTDLIGAAAMIAAFPLYRHISEKSRSRLVPRILQLTDELRSESRCVSENNAEVTV